MTTSSPRSAAITMLAHLAPLALLGGCPGGEENPEQLWLALDGRETEVRLVDFEPPPY